MKDSPRVVAVEIDRGMHRLLEQRHRLWKALRRVQRAPLLQQLQGALLLSRPPLLALANLRVEVCTLGVVSCLRRLIQRGQRALEQCRGALDLLQRVAAMEQEGKYEEALALWRQIASTRPEPADATRTFHERFCHPFARTRSASAWALATIHR